MIFLCLASGKSKIESERGARTLPSFPPIIAAAPAEQEDHDDDDDDKCCRAHNNFLHALDFIPAACSYAVFMPESPGLLRLSAN
jgi:hypothetical protein